MDLPGVVDAVYTVSVTNGDGDLVWTRQLASTTHGDGAGSLSYVGPCDAYASASTIEVTLDRLVGPDGDVPATTYDNPTPVTRDFTCVANADVWVAFDLTVVRAAQQGFFDVAVSFSDIFCSAKLDCENAETGADLLLLHDASGARVPTVVLGLACTGTTTGSTTHLYMDAPRITCTGFATPIVVDPTGDGVVDLGAGASQNVDGYLSVASVFRGDEALYAKSYWNLGFGLDTARFGSAKDCTLTATATASQGPLASSSGRYRLPNDAVYPIITWSVPVSDQAGRICHLHEVNVPGSGVATSYVTGGPGFPGFEYQYVTAGAPSAAAPPQCLPVCENGGVCTSQYTCDCAGTGFSGPTCSTGPIAFTTFDPNHRDPQRYLSQGDLFVTGDATNDGGIFSVDGVSSGKWYYEFTTTAMGTLSGHGVGLAEYTASTAGGPTTNLHWGYLMEGTVNDHGMTLSGLVSPWTVGDTVGVAVDMDNLRLGYYKNGVLEAWIETPSLAGKTVYAFVGSATSNSYQAGLGNFGQTAFVSEVPTGFNAGLGHAAVLGACSPSCANGGACVAGRCDCAGTDYWGPTCEMGDMSAFTPTAWDPTHIDPQRHLSEADLYVTGEATNNGGVFSVIGVSAGKWYYEFETTAMGDHWGHGVGLGEYGADVSGAPNTPLHWGYMMDGTLFNHGTTGPTWAEPWDLGDIIGVAVDMNGLQLGFFKNGVLQGWMDSPTLFGKTVYAFVGSAASNAYQEGRANFGQAPFAATVPDLFHTGFGQ